MRNELTVLLGMALAAACQESGHGSSDGDAAALDSNPRDAATADGGTEDAAEPIDASSADAATAADRADTGSASDDAAAADAQVGAADAGPDSSATVFVPCTGTQDVSVEVPTSNTSCEFALAGAPTQPTYLTVKLDGLGLYQRMSDGFYYEQGKLILDGEACTVAKDKQGHLLEVSLFCQ